MLEYIKKQIADRVAEQEFVSSRDDHRDDEAIVEYAHLFQELDDLSVSGTDSETDRPLGIDIPLEDDIEIESVELNLKDGRVTDVPMDATVQEYLVMKTYDDFYQEACASIPRMPREYDDAYEQRMHARAKEDFNRYQQYVVQEGLFGFGMINIDDDRVPTHINLNLGPFSDKDHRDYIVKLQLYFETKNHKITKKQLESAQIMTSIDPFMGINNYLCNQIKSYSTPDMTNEAKNVTPETIWDICRPVKALIPVEPIDKYMLIVWFEVDMYKNGQTKEFAISAAIPVKGSSKGATQDMKNVTPSFDTSESIKNINNYMSKKDALKESYEFNIPTRAGFDYFQEAIDFGDTGDDTTPPEGSSTADTSDDDAPTVSGGNPGEDSETADDDKVQVDTNDVSNQIVDKVSDATSDTDTGDDTLNTTDPEIDDTSLNDSTDDANTDDTTTGSKDIDNELDSLDDTTTSTDDAGGYDTSAVDMSNIDNMTIDELLKQGSDKLKGMTLNQLKSFLSDGTESEAVQQEAFFLTTKNINSEIDVHLRNALGILNSEEMDIETLITSFKKEGKQLNRVLSKASKMKKLYSEEERKDIGILNKCLIDLTTTLKMSKDQNYVSAVKRLIQAFTSQSKVVANIVEAHKPKKVNESYNIDDLYDEIMQDRS